MTYLASYRYVENPCTSGAGRTYFNLEQDGSDRTLMFPVFGDGRRTKDSEPGGTR